MFYVYLLRTRMHVINVSFTSYEPRRLNGNLEISEHRVAQES